MERVLGIFVSVDGFCQTFRPFWEKKLLADGSKKRQRSRRSSISEILTMIIYFHQSHDQASENMKNRFLPRDNNIDLQVIQGSIDFLAEGNVTELFFDGPMEAFTDAVGLRMARLVLL